METLNFPWYTIVMAGAGVFLCVGGILSAIARAWWLLRAQKTVGVVFDHKAYSTHKNASPRYHLMLKYQTASGETYTLTDQVSWGEPHYANGTEMPVVYHPRKPEDAEVADFLNLWALPFGMEFGGMMLLAMAALYAFVF
ncbi:MAG TPA: DUF3592 domain-containing protein [Anaerolineae bacterium]|nr:DUF3592 domain-containing protein [Anaerolineae bacterium]